MTGADLGVGGGTSYAPLPMGTPELPDFRVDVEIDGAIAILTITGDLDLASCGQARDAAQRALATPEVRSICVDLSGSRFVDSSGVAVLTRMHTATEDRGGRVVLVTDAPAILRTLSLLGLDDALEVARERPAALALLA